MTELKRVKTLLGGVIISNFTDFQFQSQAGRSLGGTLGIDVNLMKLVPPMLCIHVIINPGVQKRGMTVNGALVLVTVTSDV